jgi:hypothetical protein
MEYNPIVVWQLIDGKPGHENQVHGLINAMSKFAEIQTHRIPVPSSKLNFILSIGFGSFYNTLTDLPKPTFIIGAGNKTHLPMLLAKRWFGGQSILLMRSNWPLSWFDRAIIPMHDNPPTRDSILSTHGVINVVEPSHEHSQKKGLILIGGPSNHFNWDSASIIEQIVTVVDQSPEITWIVANSRRTPSDFFEQLSLKNRLITCVNWSETDRNWLPTQLHEVGYVWVSPDSVSMVYEAITSGAAVGCFELTKRQENRIIAGLNNLLDNHLLTSYSQWQRTPILTAPMRPLNEAERAAKWILSQ